MGLDLCFSPASIAGLGLAQKRVYWPNNRIGTGMSLARMGQLGPNPIDLAHVVRPSPNSSIRACLARHVFS
jgi:hypothetical protein